MGVCAFCRYSTLDFFREVEPWEVNGRLRRNLNGKCFLSTLFKTRKCTRTRNIISVKSKWNAFAVMQSAATIGGGGGTYNAGGTGSRARDLGLRAQKKLLGRVVSTGAGRSLLIDDATTSLLDNLYKLMERATKNNPSLDKKQPEKVLKNIVKLSIKVRETFRFVSFKLF